MEDLTAWLRATIEGDLAQAKAADEAAPGPWVNTGQDGCGDAWQIHGAPIEGVDTGFEWSEEAQGFVPVGGRVATLNYDDGGGVWEKAAADHIVLQQPRDTIARCKAELALLDEHSPSERCNGHSGPYLPCSEACEYDCEGCSDVSPCRTVRLIASGYQNRSGFKPSWLD